jgi:hypothetical protein
MARYRARWATGAALAAVAATALTGCSDNETPSSTVSKAESAARSVGGEATAAASSLASEASSALASATAEAGRRLDDIKGGVEVKDDVSLGTPATDGDKRTTVEVTAKNTAGSAKSFAVEVRFTNQDGKLLDVVVVTVSDVAAGKTGKATARSTHQLTGEVRAEVARAVRY